MALFRRVANQSRRSLVDREIDAELQAHIDLRIEDNLAAGMPPAAARRDALLRFGNPTVTKERVTAADAPSARVLRPKHWNCEWQWVVTSCPMKAARAKTIL